MAVWENAELEFPHNQGTCQPLVGDSDAQGDGRSPKVKQQEVGGLRGEEKWRPDKIGAPEAGEIRRSRWGGPLRGAGEKQRVIAQPTWAQGAY